MAAIDRMYRYGYAHLYIELCGDIDDPFPYC